MVKIQNISARPTEKAGEYSVEIRADVAAENAVYAMRAVADLLVPPRVVTPSEEVIAEELRMLHSGDRIHTLKEQAKAIHDALVSPGPSRAFDARLSTAPPGNTEATSGDTPSPAPTPAGGPPAEETQRRRRGRPPGSTNKPVPAPEPPQPAGLSDADLSKAASNAAADLDALGEDGPGIVMLVMKDGFGVESTSDIPLDRRAKFVAELRDEVELALAEKGG